MKKKLRMISLGASLIVGGLFFFSLLNLNNKKNSESAIGQRAEVLIVPGIIDSPNDVIRIPTLQAGLVKTIDVGLGETVKKGQTLFSLDSELVENNLEIQKTLLARAKNEFHMQQRALAHAKQQLKRLKIIDKRAISQVELREKLHEMNMIKLHLAEAKHNLQLAKENLTAAEIILHQFTTVAPKEGIVLQINAHINEFISGSPIVLLGDAEKIMVRVSIDERDIQLFHPHAAAYLLNNQEKIPLTFMQVSQYIVTQDRLNSRVQDVLYYFSRKKYPAFIAGQQLDVHIPLSKIS
ncbi:efflux RND transporter periplasmic adaptor subunit [Legionella cardiaca]|uniref:Biotin/lipoyl-binding protein n=1 Tax=Legionella cardiaca TaxID=1071983 RepID=A0ABY8AUL9_9GAMM|nr:biotin/lipoyl-binding protein [Legionella cardiaca]WED42832.1 biotin/lipoyl-binding protein [Legionella cardiaca]